MRILLDGWSEPNVHFTLTQNNELTMDNELTMGVDYYTSPLGVLRLVTNNSALTQLSLCQKPANDSCPDAITQKTCQQLDEYFAKKRTEFDIPVQLNGTMFQQELWKNLQAIPYGHTTSYKNLASSINRPKAYRAVGTACGRNPVPIIVPCHRVIGSDKKLTGFALGLDKKQLLLQLEEVI